MAKPGPKRKEGERYPSGDLKPAKKTTPDLRYAKRGDNDVHTRLYGDLDIAVYVLVKGGVVKIGYSGDPAHRAATLAKGLDESIEVFWAVRMRLADAKSVEAQLHKNMKTTLSHKRGEWYYFAPELAVAAIQKEIARQRCETRADIFHGFREIG